MSYDLLGAKWGATTLGTPSGEVTWALDLSAGLNYNTSLYNDSDFENAVQAAFDAWEGAASVDFEKTSNFSAADITLDMAALAGTVVGQATIEVAVLSGTDRILDVDILLDSSENWAPFGETATDFFAVALHEIGHGLGLDHVNDPSEIMNPIISTDELGDGDIAGAQLIYGRDAEDLPEPEGVSSASASGGGGGDDGGGGGGIGVVIGGILALFASIFGIGAMGPAAVLAATAASDDDHEDDHHEDDHHDHDHDHIHGIDEHGVDEGHDDDDLIAFLNDAMDGDIVEIVHELYHDKDHDAPDFVDMI